MDPSSHTFDYKDLAVSVATNNKTGYQLTMSTTSTSLINTADNTLTIPTLDALSGGYTTSTFQTNKWGYSKDSGNYFPFPASELLLQNTTATNGDNTALRFATKIDYTQPSGTYKTTISFNAVTNPLVDYIQDFTPDMCRTLASTDDYTVVDKRDDNDYTVRYINGNCWMTKNLRFIGKTGDPAGIMTLDSSTSNVESVYTTSNPLVVNYTKATSGYSNTNPIIYDSANETSGVWYNYPAASAGQIITSSTSEATRSICPAGWRLPNYSDQSQITSYNNLFKAVNVGYYSVGVFATGYSFLWSSTAYSSTARYDLGYDGNGLTVYNGGTYGQGFNVRCIMNDPRTISDITTMQEISPQIVAKMTNGDTATLTDSRDNQDYTVAKINGNLWMTRNLAIGCNGTGSTYGSTITPITLHPSDTNITSDWTTSNISATAGYDFVTPRMECNSTYGAWYDFASATAETYTGGSMYTRYSTTYNICPIGWTLPTMTQMNTVNASFLPVGGGYYHNGSYAGGGQGYWWSSDMNADYRNCLGQTLSTSCTTSRADPIYVRCIAN